MIRFACPGCSATFTVANEKAGKTGKCPKCQSQFVIPAAPDDASADAPPPLPPAAPQAPPAEAPAARGPNDPVEIQPCPKCGSRLSVMPSDVGLDIECPSCQQVFKALRADAPPPPDTGSRSSSSKLVKLGSGSKRDDDDDDDRRGSKKKKSKRRDDDDDDDDDRPSRRRSSRRSDDDDDDDDDDDRPSRRRRSSRRSYSGGGGYAEHRGVLLLVFAILGWFVCLIFAIVAWVMASQDLKEIDAGRMDPEGRGLTQAAKIISMIACILAIVGVIFYCGFWVLIVGIGAASR